MIIPAYNEEESIFDTVTSILNYRKKVDFELDYVVINDGSTDKTKEILEENHFNAVNLVMNLELVVRFKQVTNMHWSMTMMLLFNLMVMDSMILSLYQNCLSQFEKMKQI